MLTALIILALAAAILLVVLTLAIKLFRAVAFIALALTIVLLIIGVIYPETGIVEKGKNYILGKGGYLIEKGKATAYVVIDGIIGVSPKKR